MDVCEDQFNAVGSRNSIGNKFFALLVYEKPGELKCNNITGKVGALFVDRVNILDLSELGGHYGPGFCHRHACVKFLGLG